MLDGMEGEWEKGKEMGLVWWRCGLLLGLGMFCFLSFVLVITIIILLLLIHSSIPFFPSFFS